jgi:hypothetical protein
MKIGDKSVKSQHTSMIVSVKIKSGYRIWEENLDYKKLKTYLCKMKSDDINDLFLHVIHPRVLL